MLMPQISQVEKSFRQILAGLAQWQENKNKRMNVCTRAITSEWGFRKIINIFAFLDYQNLKLYLQPIGKLYTAGALLTNVHTCLDGSRGTEYLMVHAPTLEENCSHASDGIHRNEYLSI
ncbi:unnamed protein product [Discosporangium mesarthrocarpum]